MVGGKSAGSASWAQSSASRIAVGAAASIREESVASSRVLGFEALADEDGDNDPKRFEPEVIRDRLERVIILGPLVKAALELAGPLSDTRLHLSNLTRPALLAMYEIVKPQAKHDVVIASLAKAALDFFAALGKL